MQTRFNERGELQCGGAHRQLRSRGIRPDGRQARRREDEANLLRPVPARLSPDGRDGREGLLLRKGAERLNAHESLQIGLLLLNGFPLVLRLKLFLLGRHPPQDGGDKADGHLDVQRKLAKIFVGIGMMSFTIGHSCSWLNRLPQSLWTRTMICHRFGEKQVEIAKGGGKG